MNSLIDEYKEKFLKNTKIFIVEYEYSEKSLFNIHRRNGGDIYATAQMNIEQFLDIKLVAVKQSPDYNPIDFKDRKFGLISFEMSVESFHTLEIMFEWNLGYLIRN